MPRTIDVDWVECRECGGEVKGKQEGKDVWITCTKCGASTFLLS